MKATIHVGNCLQILKQFTENSIDAIVTDPPYGLEFMGKDWDAPWKTDRRQNFDGTLDDQRENPYGRSKVRNGTGASYGAGSEVMQALQEWYYMWAVECLRVLKPGGHMLAFGGSRTYHRLACAVEDAGFEIRDQIMWIYGCLDEHTELVSKNGVKQYHKASLGERVLCYDPENGEYSYQPILEIVEYDYSDTAYRLIGDFGEQVVSRNHRCIVERDGSEVLQLAETLRSAARVPILESLSELQKALSNLQSYPSKTEPILQSSLCSFADWESQQYSDTTREKKGASCSVRGLREGEVGAAVVAEKDQDFGMQLRVQRSAPRRGVETARAQGKATLEAGIGICLEDSDDRPDESSMEGRLDLPEAQGSLRRPANQVRSLSAAVPEHGSEGRLCDGTPSTGRSSDWQAAPESRSSTSQEPQSDGESTDQPDALCDERGAQGIRAWRGHNTALVRVVPFQYTGKMWCLRVPTGAFVAVRGGVAFPTGNSGFPKSLDVSKAIDKAAGAEREVIETRRVKSGGTEHINRENVKQDFRPGAYQKGENILDVTAPATEGAKQWQGWGTALKPAHEPIVVARKPLEGTVAANVQKWGTGALNIDGCRIETTESGNREHGGKVYEGVAEGYKRPNKSSYTHKTDWHMQPQGRWPANVIHDGCEEVLDVFAEFGDKSSSRANGNPNDPTHGSNGSGTSYEWGEVGRTSVDHRDAGTAARFFYTAKAASSERGVGNTHPTVKPVDLMAYLCRLVTPPHGIILDPFTGSGSTGIAALREGLEFIGIEINPEYAAIAEKRIKHDNPMFSEVELKA